MSSAQLRVVAAVPPSPTTRRQPSREQVVDLTVVQDPRMLLSVREAAYRLGVGRSFLYELIAAGRIETITIGRLRKISLEALAAFIEQQRGSSCGA